MSYNGPIVDTHHHLWDLDNYGKHYDWLNEIQDGDKLSPIKQSYLLEHLLADFSGCNVVKSVHVQGEWRGDEVGETKWLSEIAEGNEAGFPHAIVAYADLSSDSLDNILDAHSQYKRLRGIRQLLNWHDEDPSQRAAERDYLSDPKWQQQLSKLATRGLVFDTHLLPHQLASFATVVSSQPNVTFVVNHIACGPCVSVGSDGFKSWCEGMAAVGRRPNVFCKISGLIHPMHTSAGKWSIESLQPWIDAVLKAFGWERCVFGSNFPVDKVCGTYADIVAATKECLDKAGLTPVQQRAVFHDNAVKLYRLE